MTTKTEVVSVTVDHDLYGTVEVRSWIVPIGNRARLRAGLRRGYTLRVGSDKPASEIMTLSQSDVDVMYMFG